MGCWFGASARIAGTRSSSRSPTGAHRPVSTAPMDWKVRLRCSRAVNLVVTSSGQMGVNSGMKKAGAGIAPAGQNPDMRRAIYIL